jgi:hypothetical protein
MSEDSKDAVVINGIFYIDRWKENPDKNLLVIGGSYHQFDSWLRENSLSPKYSGKRIQYAKDSRDIVGKRPSEYHLIYVGEYWKNPLYSNEAEIVSYGFTACFSP